MFCMCLTWWSLTERCISGKDFQWHGSLAGTALGSHRSDHTKADSEEIARAVLLACGVAIRRCFQGGVCQGENLDRLRLAACAHCVQQ